MCLRPVWNENEKVNKKNRVSFSELAKKALGPVTVIEMAGEDLSTSSPETLQVIYSN